jgi:hypothetical protein
VKALDRMMRATRYLVAAAALLGVLLVYELATDPYEPERARLLASLNDGDILEDAQGEEPVQELPHEQILAEISSDPGRWGPLIKRPPRVAPPPKPPDLKQEIQGLTVLTVVSGANNEMQAIIRDATRRTEDIYKKGDIIRKLTVDEVASDGVVLSLEKHTIKLPF